VYLSFCQGLFAAAPRGSYHWTESLQDSEIIITDENPINVDTVGKRPCISFTRGPVQSYSLGQDDMLSYDFATGKKTKSVLIPGTMSINCCSRVDIESENLAWIIAEQLWMHRELLMKAGFFEIGRQFVVGSPSPPGSIVQGDSADEWYTTTVSSPFQFYRTSSFSPLGQQIVDGIGVQLQTKGLQVRSTGPIEPPNGSANLPYSINTTAPEVVAPLQPHPLNPAQMVSVRPAHPRRAGIKPPSINGRTIPIQAEPVEQSDAPATVVTSTFKV
jgi:hypothetical protein